MRANIGGPPESRNNASMTMVTMSASVAPVAVSTSEPLRAAGGAPGGGSACDPPISPARWVNPSIRCIQRSTGRIFRSTTCNVWGALASHCWAGSSNASVAAPMPVTRMSSIRKALTARGNPMRCSPSTAFDNTSANNNANATGMNTSCAKYNSAAIATVANTISAREARAR